MKKHSCYKALKTAKQITVLLILALPFFAFNACREDDTSTPDLPLMPSIEEEKPFVTKIMPLGASRVQGARPDFESFRYELWKELIANNKSFDFVGTKVDFAKYNSFEGSLFDRDHEGRSGAISAQILFGINSWLRQLSDTPDVVLFSSPGANDILTDLDYNQAIVNINRIIDTIQQYNPKVTIIIEQLAPGSTNFMTAKQTNELQQMQQDVVIIANLQSDSSSKVIPVDMYTGFKDSLLADQVHYNVDGAKFIARRYFMVLDSLLE